MTPKTTLNASPESNQAGDWPNSDGHDCHLCGQPKTWKEVTAYMDFFVCAACMEDLVEAGEIWNEDPSPVAKDWREAIRSPSADSLTQIRKMFMAQGSVVIDHGHGRVMLEFDYVQDEPVVVRMDFLSADLERSTRYSVFRLEDLPLLFTELANLLSYRIGPKSTERLESAAGPPVRSAAGEG